jgi:Na+-transporting NADH:ubiquinone oxidoreductase subunit C
MNKSLHTIIFSTILAVVCALLLTGASEVLKPRREANQKAEQTRNILSVLGVPVKADTGAMELLKIFEEVVTVGQQGDVTFYKYIPDKQTGKVETVAVPFEGPGLWGSIEGFLSLDTQMEKIRGISFYKQEETPGLGGDIANEPFCKQFTGKDIKSAAGAMGIRIKRPSEALSDNNEVHGISGATITGDKVESLLNETIKKIGEGRK